MDKLYAELIADLKKNIIQSRYIAAKLANKEQLVLYFKTGKMLAEKVELGKRGAKILEQIAIDLQKHLPGLRGFSARSLWYMKKLYTTRELPKEMQGILPEAAELAKLL